MAIEFRIRETPEEVSFSVSKPRNWFETIFGAIVSGIIIYFLLRSFFHGSEISRTALASIVGTAMGFFSNRDRSVSTSITKFEAHVVGKFGGGYEPQRHVPMADIAHFEYRPESGGGEGPYEPLGLYAVRDWGDTCLIPFIDESDANKAMEILYERFAHVLSQKQRSDWTLFKSNLISLNLR